MKAQIFGQTKFLIIILTAALLSTSCVTIQKNPVSGKKRIFGYTWEKEVEIGKQADGEIIAQYGLYDNQELSTYVEELGQQLLEVSHMQREGTDAKFRNTPFTFRVLDSPVVNAFALPGGYVYVTRGLMSHLENEAQLAVVLGHEIGHVAARHASQRAAEQQFGQIAVLGGAILGEAYGLDGGSIMQLSSQTAQLLFLKYGRDDERESDRLGVEYAAMKQYKAAEGAKFFTSLKRISEKAGNNIPSHLSTHPDPGEREKTIPQLAEQWAEQGYAQTIMDQDEYHMLLEGMIYGENPREGFSRDGYFYHPDLAFQFPVPQGFQVVNQRSAVILVNESQDAVMQMSIDSENQTPEASVQQFLNQEGITTVDQSVEKVNGLNAYTATADAETQNGTLRVQVSALSYDDTLYRFLSYTDSDKFVTYSADFRQVFKGFDALYDEQILNIQPVRLSIVRTDRSASLRELLPDTLPMDVDPENVAIINQVMLDDTIPAGTLIKIPVQ